jgi:NAD(P)-dependent dehydrogenase (short-subunit alcohol dehydrogenase family)
MQLQVGQVAVVTGAGSGIGFGLADGFAARGLSVVLADVQADALDAAVDKVRARGVEAVGVITDVSKEADVQALAAATLERFGAVHVVCNNAGVAAKVDPWFGPLSGWEWVFGVNTWGIIHGVRAFLPHLLGGGHIVNTSSMAGLMTGFSPAYDASKHAAMALSVDLYNDMQTAGLPVGVSCLCPGWVRTGIMESERNWPDHLGPRPEADRIGAIQMAHVNRAIDEGATPAAMAAEVIGAIEGERFWVIPHQDFLDLAISGWDLIAERANPQPNEQVPGLPPRSQMIAEVMAAMAAMAEATSSPDPDAS